MLLKNKLNEVKSLLNSNNVLATLEERYCYSKDASNAKTKSLVPDLVVFVETVEDVQKTLKYANEHEIPIVCRGAGSNMVGACLCSQGGIVLNFSKMNKILDFNKTNMTITVESGVVLGDLKQYVEAQGLFYPPDPSSYKIATIGGSIAQSSGGAMSFKYGTTKDYVLSLKVVTSTGEIMSLGAQTSKNSSGYHLTQLMVGSEGTLGVIVEATLRLIPKPEVNKSIVAYFNSVEKAVEAVNKIIDNQIFPAAIDYMDKNSMLTVEEFVHCGLKVQHECMLLIDIDGYKESIDTQIGKVRKAIEEVALEIIIPKTEEETKAIWLGRSSSYSATTRLAPDVISDDIIVTRDKLASLVQKCNEIVKKYGLKMCMVGHIGDGNLHPQIALDLDNEEEFRNYISAKSEIYKAVAELGGLISAEHGIGADKLPYLVNFVDKNSLIYMKMIKKIFDPKNILNPDKIFKF